MDKATFKRNERQARAAGEDFVQFLERSYGILDLDYGHSFNDARGRRWAQSELFGFRRRWRPRWTVPKSVLL